MADRALRGAGLGSKSFEDETGVEFAPRRQLGFDCPKGHHFDLTFAEEAETPTAWECPRCGLVSKRTDGVVAEPKETKPQRTHWDMLRERRSIAELEELLTERLTLLRDGQIGPGPRSV
ncbi:RNA polymerase-binding protein RbpA [Propionibacteriaceae bacterium Y2011]|uniref:RNA polymerase-binding protein RbpA n=1 Tax=Microlunatus sp. Y2014 TaxID=3418488 RepID=UPI003B4AE193